MISDGGDDVTDDDDDDVGDVVGYDGNIVAMTHTMMEDDEQ